MVLDSEWHAQLGLWVAHGVLANGDTDLGKVAARGTVTIEILLRRHGPSGAGRGHAEVRVLEMRTADLPVVLPLAMRADRYRPAPS